MGSVLREEKILRIEKYIGKEKVKKMMEMRFENEI